MREEIRKYAVDVLEQLWLCIDFEKMSNSRKLGIWDEFSGKVRACANSSKSFEIFVEKMAKKINSKSFDTSSAELIEISSLNDEIKKQILKLYREQLSIVMLEVRLRRDDAKQKFKSKENSKPAKKSEHKEYTKNEVSAMHEAFVTNTEDKNNE